MSDTMLTAALAYGARGWAVLPLVPGAKRPLTANGFKDATTDPGQIAAWWTQTPDANIGVATGAASGITVVDVDVKSWKAKNGDVTLRALTERHGELPLTLSQQTWSGGTQLLFAYSADAPNGVDCYGPWLDGRNDGGYVVVPPSRVVEDAREGEYRWLSDPASAVHAAMPAWLLAEAKLRTGRPPKYRNTETRRTIAEIAGTSRNVALTSLAGSMRRRDASDDAVRQALLAENAGFADPLSASEVEGIVASATRNFKASVIEDLDARYTDKANAERLAQASGDRIRYCDDLNRWFAFDGVRWVRTSRFGVAPFVTDLAKAFYQHAAVEHDADKRRRFSEEGRKLESTQTVRHVIEMAQALPELRIRPDEFDSDGHLLNVENGTLDLRSGELLARDPAHRITKLAPVSYDPGARSALWDDTINLVTCGDAALATFLQLVFGYTLTGSTSESMFFIFFGPGGSNGKTTVLETVATVLGDYATTLRVQALLAGQDDKIPHDFADLLGARFVVTSELPKGKRYDEATLKLVTGGDEITACHKYGNNFRYYPSFKLFMSTNFDPTFSAGDDALWNRAKTVPFRFSFKTYSGADKTAKDRLKEPEHRAALLTWAVTGSRLWRAIGLRPPAVVERETTRHRKEVDVIQAFIDEKCAATDDPAATVSNQELYRTYRAWSREQPSPQTISSAEFIGEMQRAGYQLVRPYVGGHRHDRWDKLRLRGDRE